MVLIPRVPCGSMLTFFPDGVSRAVDALGDGPCNGIGRAAGALVVRDANRI